MSMLITQPAHPPQAMRLPEPRMPIAIRPATMDDFAFIDALQGKHTKQVGWMPRAQLEGKIGAGHVLVAEVPGPLSFVPCGGAESKAEPTTSDQGQGTSDTRETSDTRLGFVIGNDQYFKRDDCGIIYQLCVVEGQRRGLIGAALVKAMFERAAWGCKLFCCWCAQDLSANHFWESLGFVPLAFRSGSRTKGKGKTPRVHIFWQKRVREGDTETPYWFPSETKGGSIREDRLVFPIPTGTHWSDAKPIVLPERHEGTEARRHEGTDSAASPRDAGARSSLTPSPSATTLSRRERGPETRKAAKPITRATNPPPGVLRGFSFAPPPSAPVAKPKPVKPVVKNDPRYVAFARELRDRYLEAVNADPAFLLPRAKYELGRALPIAEAVPPPRRALVA